jgi:glycosyltransferase involved in cell wall biosynthesis
MPTMKQSFEAYTRAVLSFRLGDGGGGYATAEARTGALATIARQAGRRERCLLLGVGRGEAARDLAGLLPAGTELTVCELYPEQARKFGAGLPVLADASPVALSWLLLSVGLLHGQTVCALNPEIADVGARRRFQAMQKLHAAFEPWVPPASLDALGPPNLPGFQSPQSPGKPAAGSSLSLAAILHPEEPDLEGFFAALPPRAFEMVVVWDAAEVPGNIPASPVPIRHLAHPLGHDFAAQRNRMLDACRGDWVLYLDGDERLSPALAGLLPLLCGQDLCRAFAFPRLAVTPAGVKIGWGLWPDLQLRLFRRDPGVRFARPVHERLEGLSGPTGLTVGAGVRHLSDVLKSPETLARKHALFDQSAQSAQSGCLWGAHRQNPEYPTLPEAFFSSLTPKPFLGLWPETVRFQPL